LAGDASAACNARVVIIVTSFVTIFAIIIVIVIIIIVIKYDWLLCVLISSRLG
jgi:hypothetical protein